MEVLKYWLKLQVPLWWIFVIVLVCILVGYLIGLQQKRSEVEEAVNAEFLRRRNDLADRGRVTERRPEQQGAQPAVNRRMQVVSRRPSPPDRPRNQL